jgi:hypothetical protein
MPAKVKCLSAAGILYISDGNLFNALDASQTKKANPRLAISFLVLPLLQLDHSSRKY